MSTISLERARTLLVPFNGKDRLQLDNASDRQEIAIALKALVAESDYQTLGVCAETAAAGYAALVQYLAAFGYTDGQDFPQDCGSDKEPIYIKFNTRNSQTYAEAYSGPSRGVLVCCHAVSEGSNTDIYGYLPLNLFD
ncbi:DUF1824 family protein [Synechococcus sp. PCC 7336]|uniref:DUF1824 family protein n=1 Tax=Synechococcus sp. PCC 7336 TaxID=195250 RepID=UPI000348A4D1|nr:DUF1824 family protein [Synechococcus sp. PCC 7336]